MNQALLERLMNVLDNVPVTTTRAGRDILLDGIPRNITSSFYRYDDNKHIDLQKLLDQLERVGRLEETRARPLLIFIENARKSVIGTSLGRDLQEIISELEQYYEDTVASFPYALSLPALPEVLIFGGSDERLPHAFFEGALRVQKGIVSLRVPRIFGNALHKKPEGVVGTGWLVASQLLITNHHVIAARLQGEPQASSEEFHIQAEQAVAWFDYLTEDGTKAECRCIKLLHEDVQLDYALLRLEDTPVLAGRPVLSIARQLALHQADRLNIVQHPGGGPLKYAIRNNFYIGPGKTPNFIRYLTDTEGGASGSPVFDDDWLVVALHHAAQKVPPKSYKGETIKYHNEGIELQAILHSLPKQIQQEICEAQGWEE
jgi:endonuclease G